MELLMGYYWVRLTNGNWIIAYWDGHYFWNDGDDYSQDYFLEIDSRQIERTEEDKKISQSELINLFHNEVKDFFKIDCNPEQIINRTETSGVDVVKFLDSIAEFNYPMKPISSNQSFKKLYQEIISLDGFKLKQ